MPVMHLIWWQGADNAPDDYKTLHDGFRELNPHWRVEWWDRERILDNNLPHRDLIEHADQYVPEDSAHQMRSDIARYGILHRHGGTYMDLDYRHQKPLDKALGRYAGRFLTAWELQNRWVANGFLHAPRPRHRAMKAMLEAIPGNIVDLAGKGLRANALTGPKLWTRIVREQASVKVLNQGLFHPAPWWAPEEANKPWPAAVAVHLFGHQRTLKGIR